MTLPTRTLGRTGQTVTALGLGGVCWNLADEDAEAVTVVHRAIDLGITYLDTASKYKDSERRLGLALKDRDRDGLFVATKCMERSGAAVRQEIAASFEHLGVERIDLMQLHAIDEAGTLEEALRPDGALRVIEEYRRQGRIRFVGLTGHTHPAHFVRMIGEYDFDTVLNPLGAANRVWNDFSTTTLPAARARGMGIMAMKVMAYGQVPEQDRGLFLRYAMGLDLDVAVVGMDTVEQVEENVALAEAFTPLTPAEERRLFDVAGQVAAGDKGKLFWLPETRAAG